MAMNELDTNRGN